MSIVTGVNLVEIIIVQKEREREINYYLGEIAAISMKERSHVVICFLESKI